MLIMSAQVPGSLRSSNGQRSICLSKLGICFFVRMTLPFADIIAYSLCVLVKFS